MAVNFGQLNKTYTPPGGAGQGVLAQAVKPYTSTVPGPPNPPQQPATQAPAAPAAPAVAQTPPAQAPAAPASFTGPNNPADILNAPDVQALQQQRATLIDQLFNHDQDLANIYANPQSPYYIANPATRLQAGQAPVTANQQLVQTINSVLGSIQSKAKLSPTEQKQNYMQQLTDTLSSDQGNTPIQQIVAAYKPYLPINDIIDTYNNSSPTPLSLPEMQQFGYKTTTQVAKANNSYQAASTALQQIDALDEASKQANAWYGWVYNNPTLVATLGKLGGQGIISAYPEARKGMSLNILKSLLSLSYPGGATMVMGLIPTSYDSEEQRAFKVGQLRAFAQSRMNEAQSQAGNIALGPPTPGGVANTAMTPPAPTTAQIPATQAPTAQYQTSTGKTFSILPTQPTTAMTQ